MKFCGECILEGHFLRPVQTALLKDEDASFAVEYAGASVRKLLRPCECECHKRKPCSAETDATLAADGKWDV